MNFQFRGDTLVTPAKGRLTKRVVDAAPAKTAPYFLWCGELHGFGCRVFSSGKKVFYADYRNSDGVRRRMAIGPHGKITVEQARKLALAILGAVVKGDDPALERATGRKALTMAELCDRYLAAAGRGLILNKRGRPKKASTLATDRGRVARHIKPLLGSKRVRDLTAADVSRFIRDVTDGKTATVEKTPRGKAVVMGGRGTATRTAAVLSAILTFAVHEGILTVNPARGVQRPAGQRRTRRLSTDEYRALGQALDGESRQVVAIVRLLALSGARPSEIIRLKWSETDSRCLRLHDTKTGPSVRPLGKAALAVLAGLPRTGENVFPATRRGQGGFGGMARGWHRLVKRAGLTGVTLGTLRHSFASTADDLGFTRATIGALMGHSVGNITAGYIHKSDPVLLAAADRVAAAIDGHMTRRGGRPSVPDKDLLEQMAFRRAEAPKASVRRTAALAAATTKAPTHMRKTLVDRLRTKYRGDPRWTRMEEGLRKVPGYWEPEPE